MTLKGTLKEYSSDDSDGGIYEEVANLSRRVERMVRKNKNFRHKFANNFSNCVGKCFSCGEPGHIVKDCPNVKESYVCGMGRV